MRATICQFLDSSTGFKLRVTLNTQINFKRLMIKIPYNSGADKRIPLFTTEDIIYPGT